MDARRLLTLAIASLMSSGCAGLGGARLDAPDPVAPVPIDDLVAAIAPAAPVAEAVLPVVEIPTPVEPPSPQEGGGAAASSGATLRFQWSPGQVYPVRTSPLRVTTLTLAPGETVLAKAAGDTVRWMIGEARSGAGAAARTHVLVKPLERGLATNLVLTTDRRLYLIELSSGAASGLDPLVEWSVEEPPAPAAAGEAVDAAPPDAAVPDATAAIHAAYRVRAGRRPPSWTPTAVFDDGRRTFIQFPPAMDRREAPALFLIGADGQAETVNYRQSGDFYVVDGLIDRAELRLGTGRRAAVVRLERLAGVAR